jgi:acyl-CoA hydrolase
MKIISEEELTRTLSALVLDDPRIVVSGNFATPQHLMQLVNASLAKFRLFGLNAQFGWPQRDGVTIETPFIGPGARNAPHLRYIPARLSLVPRLFEAQYRPDVVVIHTSTPRAGKVSLGIEVNIIPSAIESVRRHGGLVIAQMNPQMPYTYGDGELDLEEIDCAIELDQTLPSPEPHEIDGVSQAIGEHVARYVQDGSTLQLGIGDVPDAALAAMQSRRNLAVWSEMISDGVMQLETHGVLDRQREIVSSFLFGSPEMYAWAHENRRLVMRRTDVVNDPALIESRSALVSINAALQVDLYAQANATHVRGQIYSGFGGQPDFVAGALHSRGGHALIALHSWHEKSDSSCVVPLLSSPVCTFQHSVIVSEHGAAEIFGHTLREQAALIAEKVADPRARDALREAALQMG